MADERFDISVGGTAHARHPDLAAICDLKGFGFTDSHFVSNIESPLSNELTAVNSFKSMAVVLVTPRLLLLERGALDQACDGLVGEHDSARPAGLGGGEEQGPLAPGALGG